MPQKGGQENRFGIPVWSLPCVWYLASIQRVSLVPSRRLFPYFWESAGLLWKLLSCLYDINICKKQNLYPAFAIILERLLAAKQCSESQDECCSVAVHVAQLDLKACQKLTWGKAPPPHPPASQNMPLGILSILEDEDWQMACLFLFCLFHKCQESYKEDKNRNLDLRIGLWIERWKLWSCVYPRHLFSCFSVHIVGKEALLNSSSQVASLGWVTSWALGYN